MLTSCEVLYGTTDAKPAVTTELTLSCHPAYLQIRDWQAIEGGAVSFEGFESLYQSKSVRAWLDSREPETERVGSARSYLHQQAAKSSKLFENDELSVYSTAKEKGRQEALSFLSELLKEDLEARTQRGEQGENFSAM